MDRVELTIQREDYGTMSNNQAVIGQERSDFVQEMLEQGSGCLTRIQGCVHDSLRWVASDIVNPKALIAQPMDDLSQYSPRLLSDPSILTLRHFLMMRLNRYIKALIQLIACDEREGQDHYTFAINGFYPVMKSMFELCVEYQLATCYIKAFGDSLESQTRLVGRVYWYSEWNRCRVRISSNRRNLLIQGARQIDLDPTAKSRIIAEKDKDLERLLPQMNLYFGESFGDNSQAEGLKKLTHWYPGSGSLQDRCTKVLPQYANPTWKIRWPDLYNTFYDRLNLHSHPATGYTFDTLPLEQRLDVLLMEFAHAMWIAQQTMIGPWIEDALPREKYGEVGDALRQESNNLQFWAEKALEIEGGDE